MEKNPIYTASIEGSTWDKVGITSHTWISHNQVREDLLEHFDLKSLDCPCKVTKFEDGSYKVS